MRYFPLLRGKQAEMLALKNLASEIAENGNVVPIIEPVRNNSTTTTSLNAYKEVSMPFLLICNPIHGDFVNDSKQLSKEVITSCLDDYNNWSPTLYVNWSTSRSSIERFKEEYKDGKCALIYYRSPRDDDVLAKLVVSDFAYHVYFDGRIESDFLSSIPSTQLVKIVDPFNRQHRNADYPPREMFTDLNTISGNSADRNFGDFSIQGDYFTDDGGAAYAVAVHHIHSSPTSSALYVSHFLSDRTQTPGDITGKILEAINNLVGELDRLWPNDTRACDEYREMSRDRRGTNLEKLKRLSIMQHLEVILGEEGLRS